MEGIVVDECHHLSAFTFEQILRRAKAKYILGLTATPIRKDGHARTHVQEASCGLSGIRLHDFRDGTDSLSLIPRTQYVPPNRGLCGS